MTYAEFQEHWEEESAAERACYDAMPVAELLARIEGGRLGDHYAIWRAVGERADLSEAGWILFDVLESDLDYLHRYHCAAALLGLAGVDDPSDQAVRYSAREVHDVAKSLEDLRRLITERIGERA